MTTIPDHAKKVFDGIIFEVHHYEQELYDGSTTTFEMLKRNNSVQCIATVGDQVLLIRDSQPERNTLWALPGGQADDRESSTDAIKREFMEETGYSTESFELYTTYNIGSKIEWDIKTFIARGAALSATIKNDPGERTEVHLVSFEEFIDIVCSKDFRETEFALDILRMYKNGTLEAFKTLLFPN